MSEPIRHAIETAAHALNSPPVHEIDCFQNSAVETLLAMGEVIEFAGGMASPLLDQQDRLLPIATWLTAIPTSSFRTVRVYADREFRQAGEVLTKKYKSQLSTAKAAWVEFWDGLLSFRGLSEMILNQRIEQQSTACEQLEVPRTRLHPRESEEHGESWPLMGTSDAAHAIEKDPTTVRTWADKHPDRLVKKARGQFHVNPTWMTSDGKAKWSAPQEGTKPAVFGCGSGVIGEVRERVDAVSFQ
jgi:hypothetical protein